MGKASDRSVKRQQKRRGEVAVVDERPQRVVKAGPLEPQTEAQKRYIAAIKAFTLTFGVGPAGTGKTYIAGAMAAMALTERRTDRIIITRPAVDAGESLGFLPGELEEKYLPYIEPFLDVLNERLGPGQVKAMISSGRIIAAPLAYMRGKTFKDSFVILDEAQNTTPEQMKLFLTRIGNGARVVVNGDESQQDIRGRSGLTDAVSRLETLSQVRVIRFNVQDIVRSGLVQEIVERYSKDLPQGEKLGA